ncbi:sialate O-acetylesterase [Akkermansiaceae bacterium]|nr:sialate O-acetylesterase [Akkermansiaceae bacterium]MDB4628679.1 sialate O-acetylesterase [Akkermansiaceae bacterium]
MKHLISGLGFAMAFASFSAASPLKVYILAGQSNMEGHAKLSSFDHIGMDPKTVPILEEMRGGSGEPVELEDVWISYRTGKEEDQPGVGKLTAGFGARRVSTENDGKIGPEFTFGIYTRKLVKEPILIIKTAWGGKSINTDFRPPSAGPYQFNKKQLDTFKKQGKDIAEMKADRNSKVGRYFQMMMEHVRSVLADPGKVHPAYNAKDGYELSGFVWFQGWNDMVDRGTYPDRGNKGGYNQYSEVMAHFIRDVRRELKSPKLPFVIGVMGAGGPTDLYGPRQQRYKDIHQYFRDSMAAPASLPEFKGNVTAVLTEKYWDSELDAVDKKRGEIRSKEKELKEKGLSKKEIANQLRSIEARLFTARDRELLKGITNADYHYKGSAKIMAQIGKAFAEALEGSKK